MAVTFDPILVHEWLSRSAQHHPEKEALVCGPERWTYGRLDQAVSAMAYGLMLAGLRRHDRVVTYLDNTSENVISLYGTLKAGAVGIIAPGTIKAPKLQYILEDSDARFLICDVTKAREVCCVLEKEALDLQVIWVGDPKRIPGLEGFYAQTWADMMACADSVDLDTVTYPRMIDVDLALLIYTSGSTGSPKGVMSTHHNVISAARSIIQYLENDENDRILNVLPLSFDYGLYQIIMTFMFGGTMFLERSFLYLHAILEKIDKERITGFPIQPTITAMLLRLEHLGQYDLRSVRYMTNTGAALPLEHIQALRSLFPWISLYSMFGLTECKRVGYLPPEFLDSHPDSVGQAMPNCEVAVVDENGQPVPPGQIGQLTVRGSNVMQGYWHDAVLTERAYLPGDYPADRTLFSGDYFHQDEQGLLYFEGRRDDMIKSRGERINTLEVEKMLLTIPSITEAAVVGVPDDLLGYVIWAFVVQAGDMSLDSHQVIHECTRIMEPASLPRQVTTLRTLPRNSNGKIDKNELKRIAGELYKPLVTGPA
ncbi:MAG: AMP-binding protein [Phycisphaerae bacterium]|nr:AMP-binding protein [Phycisphaerae bacterium]